MENGDNPEIQQHWRRATIISFLEVLVGPHPRLTRGWAGLWPGLRRTFISVAVNLAPIGTFYNIYRKKCTQGFSGLPYVFALSTALVWILYGLPSITPHATVLLTINSIASAMQICYLTIYLRYGKSNRRRHLLKVMAICFTVLAIGSVVTLGILKHRDSRAFLVRSLCVFFGVMYLGSPLTVARIVIITKSVEFLPIVLCCFLFINSVVWSFYGLVTVDRFVMIPNLFGAVFGVAQLSLYVMYRNHKPLDPYDPSNYKQNNVDASHRGAKKASGDREKSQRGPKQILDDKARVGDAKHGESGDVKHLGNAEAKFASENGNLANGNPQFLHQHHVDVPEKDQPANGDVRPPANSLQGAGLLGQASRAFTFDSPNRTIPQSPKTGGFTVIVLRDPS